MGTRTAHLHLDLDLEAEPISGRISLEDGEPLPFVGYTGLISALEAIRAGEQAASPS
jgi:hypothetical protein